MTNIPTIILDNLESSTSMAKMGQTTKSILYVEHLYYLKLDVSIGHTPHPGTFGFNIFGILYAFYLPFL